MTMQVQFFSLFFTLSLITSQHASATSPMFRMKAGSSSLQISGGAVVDKQSLNSMITLQPGIHWEMSQFSSRLGIHYLQELGGPYGLTTVTGIGISGYYYLRGISTTYSIPSEGTVIQKSIPGPFLYGGITPVNFNVNRIDATNSSQSFYASSFVFDVAAGVGYDYTISNNMILSGELLIRNAAGAGDSGGAKAKAGETGLSYRGFSFMLSYATSYY
jgi:hypothetical protein